MPVRRHLDECGSNPLAVAILVGKRRINFIRKRHRGPRCRSVLWDAAVWSRGLWDGWAVSSFGTLGTTMNQHGQPLIAFHAFQWIIGFVSPVVDLPVEQLKRQLRAYKKPNITLHLVTISPWLSAVEWVSSWPPRSKLNEINASTCPHLFWLRWGKFEESRQYITILWTKTKLLKMQKVTSRLTDTHSNCLSFGYPGKKM